MKKVFGFIILVCFALFVFNNISQTNNLVEDNQIPDYTEVNEEPDVNEETETTQNEVVEVKHYEPIQHSQEAIDYFNTICRGSEFGSGDEISKWNGDVNVYVIGEKRPYLINELKNVVSELNSYIDPININFVNSKSDANFIVLFGSAQDYVDLEPYAKDYVSNNWGLFTVNSGPVIYDANMFVDIQRCDEIDAQKHLIREEFTQALGFKQDSYDYPKSMFYQGWTTTTKYAPIDIEIIKMLYNEQ